MNKICHWLYCLSLAPIHLKSARERIKAFEIFTGMTNNQFLHSDVIKFVCEELKEQRNKYIEMMQERNKWKKLYEEREAKFSYLLGRDTLCSNMANTINSHAFEIAKLKGYYDKLRDEHNE